MITLQHLTIGYHARSPLLQPIQAQLPPATLVALLGRNGTGKSTLLRTLANLLPPLSGSIMGPKPAIVLTTMPQLRHTTVRQMVAYGRLPFTGFMGRLSPADLAAADAAILQVDIQSLSPRLFSSLSDGERQKVMIAQALAQQPQVLLLDEPSAFLDYPSRLQLFQLLRQLAHQHSTSILLSTHDVELARRFSDQLWLIADGHLTTGLAPEAEFTL